MTDIEDGTGAIGGASETARTPVRAAGRGDTSVARQLTRGAIGFGLIGSAFALTSDLGPAALLLAPAGMVALRGCPTCWAAGLIETVSAGRLQRACDENGCTPRRSPTSTTTRAPSHAGN